MRLPLSALARRGRVRTVLVVDDEPLVGRSLERRFRHDPGIRSKR
jgi:hypothetical protein